MTVSAALPGSRPAGSRTTRRQSRVLPGFGLSLGVTVLFVGVVILLPFAALLIKAGSLGPDAYWRIVSSPRAVASYALTLRAACWATLFNAAYGLLMAWVLVRCPFPGRRIVDAAMDLPFALPTAVAGVALTALLATNGWVGALFAPTKIAYAEAGIVIAMAFVSAPFVVRSVQPVLEDLEPELEEAARTLGAREGQVFWRVVFPALLPAFLTGCSLAFARCLGEFGAVIFIAGNLPFVTEITPLLIFIRLEEFEYPAASAIASVVLVAALVVLFAVHGLQAWQRREARR